MGFYFDQWDDCMDIDIAPCKLCIHHLPVVYTGARAMQGAVAEKSCYSQMRLDSRFLPLVGMTPLMKLTYKRQN